jgi:hypothetical protein
LPSALRLPLTMEGGAPLVRLVVTGAIFFAAAASPTVAIAASRPNFVFIFCDDMRVSDMAALPKTKELIVKRGTYMDNFFVNTPVCCPSRATLFSGRYPHNNVVPESAAPDGENNCCMHMNL